MTTFRAPERHLVLVGLMGAGKTAVGTECARLLGRPFVDTDLVVEEAAGTGVAAIFSSEGEEGFRRREADAVAQAASGSEPAVIACGGGAVLSEVNRETLRAHGFVVWLTAEPAVLAERVAASGPASGAGSGARPLLAGDAQAAVLTRLGLERDAAYRQAADAVVRTDHLDVGGVAAAVLAAYELGR